MFRKKLIQILACVLSASCLLSSVSAVVASADDTIGSSESNTQVFILNEEDNGQPPVYYDDDGIMICGDEQPSTSNVWNLSSNDYTSYVSEFKHLVYTNYCFTVNEDNSRMYVKFGGDDYLNYIKNKLADDNHDYTFKITLYKYKSLLGLDYSVPVDSVTYTPLPTSSYIGKVFTGLESGVKYFVSIEKTQDYIYIYNSNLTVELI